MLNLIDPASNNCQRVPRRSFLKCGSLAGGLTLAGLLNQRAASASSARSDTAVIQINLCGGPSQHDTFDPKPDAPAEYRGPFRPIQTRLPGVCVSEWFPRLAEMLDRFSVIRSVHHGDGSHHHSGHWMMTGFYPQNLKFYVNERPAMGAVAARFRGASQPGMPAYVATPGGLGYGNAAYLGGAFNPFEVGNPNAPDFAVRDLQLAPGLSGERLSDRRHVLEELDRLRQSADARGTMADVEAFTTMAFDMLSGPAVRRAFDLGAEEPRQRDRYGRTRLGQSCLLARRLVEAGVTLVHIDDYEHVEWDLHGVTSATTVDQGTRIKGPDLDRSLSQLVSDLSERGLLDRVLVQVFGEFGRTPQMNPSGGRDHWGNVFCALLAGGGLRHGQVIGASDSRGALPQDRPLRPEDLLATTYHVLGIDPQLAPPDYSGRPVPLLPGGEPIRELL